MTSASENSPKQSDVVVHIQVFGGFARRSPPEIAVFGLHLDKLAAQCHSAAVFLARFWAKSVITITAATVTPSMK